uniref:receptor-type tyrosine-protein phosphatase eta-like isoform X3 n=1 Tax=Myxine glutinosa TaxID=7769 RepID=UPI00358E62BD
MQCPRLQHIRNRTTYRTHCWTYCRSCNIHHPGFFLVKHFRNKKTKDKTSKPFFTSLIHPTFDEEPSRKNNLNTDEPFPSTEKIHCSQFGSHCQKLEANGGLGFAEQYEKLKNVGRSEPRAAGQLPNNVSKNRYQDVIPYDHSRVHLSVQHNDNSSDYINASYIPGFSSPREFIASQGPLPNTVVDFWRMVWEKKVSNIVMLAQCVEAGRKLDNETRTVSHYHFHTWPDKGVPKSTSHLIDFVSVVYNERNKMNTSPPTVVHCSAGVGRTGTFLALDHAIQQIERENMVSLCKIVKDMRINRCMMVQTESQYIFLHNCVMDYLKPKTSTGDQIYENFPINS